jgi:hypothetical protein
MNTELVPMDKLAKVYLRIRTAKAELTTQYEAELAELDKQEDEIENAMKTQMMALGTKSMKTDAGTVFQGFCYPERRRRPSGTSHCPAQHGAVP